MADIGVDAVSMKMSSFAVDLGVLRNLSMVLIFTFVGIHALDSYSSVGTVQLHYCCHILLF